MDATFDGQFELELRQPLHAIEDWEMPSDSLVNSWGEDGEQIAIRYQMDRAMVPGVNRAALAREAGMNPSQWSLLYDGQRGIPVHRSMKFLKATKSTAVLKWYAFSSGCVLKTRREWGRITRQLDEKDSALKAKDARIAELEQRLSQYEDVEQAQR